MIKVGNEMGFTENIEAQCLVSSTPDPRRKFKIVKLHDHKVDQDNDEAKFELQCYVYDLDTEWELVWTWATEMRRECIATKNMLIDAGRAVMA